MPLNIYEVAEQSHRLNEMLGSFDVDHMRQRGACLGGAESLLSDALRFVLVDQDEHVRRYFEQAIRLAQEAVAVQDKSIYDSAAIASLFAYRVAFLSAWAVGDPRTEEFGDKAVSVFQSVASREDFESEHPNHALTAMLVVAIHAGIESRLLPRLSFSRPCREGHEWCEFFQLSFGIARGLPDPQAIARFFQREVRAQDIYSIAGPGCSVPTAMSFAEITRLPRVPVEPFAVLRSLRSNAA